MEEVRPVSASCLCLSTLDLASPRPSSRNDTGPVEVVTLGGKLADHAVHSAEGGIPPHLTRGAKCACTAAGSYSWNKRVPPCAIVLLHARLPTAVAALALTLAVHALVGRRIHCVDHSTSARHSLGHLLQPLGKASQLIGRCRAEGDEALAVPVGRLAHPILPRLAILLKAQSLVEERHQALRDGRACPDRARSVGSGRAGPDRVAARAGRALADASACNVTVVSSGPLGRRCSALSCLL
eukprot:scaffold27043_cov101-Isochrysis_galbana.AAC.2